MAAVIIMVVAVVGAAVAMAPGKGSGKNPEKSFPRREGGFPSRLLMQKGARVGVIGKLIDALPVQEG